MKNVYYDTKDCGLEQVDVLDEEGLSYEFNTFLIVQDIATGRVFYATDSGCSCPTPFEEYHFNSADDTNLTEITLGDSFTSFQREIEGFRGSQEEIEKAIDSVKAILKAKVLL